MPMSFASRSPCMSASYSATLFEAVKWICRTYSSQSPLGKLSMMLAPKPTRIFEPSKCSFHIVGIRNRWQVLVHRPVNKEICHRLRLDGDPGLVSNAVGGQLDGPLG